MNYRSSWTKSTPPSQKNKTKQGGHILHVELNFPDICIDTDMKTPPPTSTPKKSGSWTNET